MTRKQAFRRRPDIVEMAIGTAVGRTDNHPNTTEVNYTEDGYVEATDGKVMVRARRAPDTIETDGSYPKIKSAIPLTVPEYEICIDLRLLRKLGEQLFLINGGSQGAEYVTLKFHGVSNVVEVVPFEGGVASKREWHAFIMPLRSS